MTENEKPTTTGVERGRLAYAARRGDTDAREVLRRHRDAEAAKEAAKQDPPDGDAA